MASADRPWGWRTRIRAPGLRPPTRGGVPQESAQDKVPEARMLIARIVKTLHRRRLARSQTPPPQPLLLDAGSGAYPRGDVQNSAGAVLTRLGLGHNRSHRHRMTPKTDRGAKRSRLHRFQISIQIQALGGRLRPHFGRPPLRTSGFAPSIPTLRCAARVRQNEEWR